MTQFKETVFVWTGGALFVASLALTGWAYGITFGLPAPFGRWQPILLDVLLFSVFALHHSVFARPGAKAALAAVVPERLLRSVYVWIASLLLMALLLVWQTVGGEIYRAPALVLPIHVAIQLAGVWLIAGAVRAIDALELAGIRPAANGQASGSASENDDTELQTSGPYGLVRHPLYLGWVLIVFGTSHLTGDRLAFAAISVCYLMIAVPWEERGLERTFGERYVRYRSKVRWRIVPYVY